jgi:hypothetical protein
VTHPLSGRSQQAVARENCLFWPLPAAIRVPGPKPVREPNRYILEAFRPESPGIPLYVGVAQGPLTLQVVCLGPVHFRLPAQHPKGFPPTGMLLGCHTGRGHRRGLHWTGSACGGHTGVSGEGVPSQCLASTWLNRISIKPGAG